VKGEHGILTNCVLGAFAFLIMIQVAWNLSGKFHGKLQQCIILTLDADEVVPICFDHPWYTAPGGNFSA